LTLPPKKLASGAVGNSKSPIVLLPNYMTLAASLNRPARSALPLGAT
jgi:hypothetical protein